MTRAFSVELRGFEPLTPSMRTRCATGLRYSPKTSQRLSGAATSPTGSANRGTPVDDVVDLAVEGFVGGVLGCDTVGDGPGGGVNGGGFLFA
jgi:hypothetical protein